MTAGQYAQSLDARTVDGVIVLTLTGNPGPRDMDRLHLQAMNAAGERVPCVIDLTGCRLLDARAQGTLLRLAGEAERVHVRLAVVLPDGDDERIVWTASRLGRFFTEFQSRADALAAMGGDGDAD